MGRLNNKTLKITGIVFIVISLIFVIYASVTLRGMYLDGSFFMLSMLKNFDANDYWGVLDFTRTRFFIMFLLEAPVSIANLVFRIDNKNALMMIYSCSQFLLPLMALLWSYKLAERTRRMDIFFWNLFTYCCLSLTFSIFSVSEHILGAALQFILWNYLAAKIDYNKKDIFLIIFLTVVMFGTFEYEIFLGQVFFIASVIYANREKSGKNRRVKYLIGFGSLFAAVFDAVFMIRTAVLNPSDGRYFIKELYDYIPMLPKMCSLISIAAIIFLIIAFFKKKPLSKTFIGCFVFIASAIFIKMLFYLDVSLNPMWESHLRSIPFWFLPLLFFGMFIFDLLKRKRHIIKIQNYIVIVLICGIFQTIWQCVHTYYWDVNVKYMKKQLAKTSDLLYPASKHKEISSFHNDALRRYIWWGNYAVMSILLSDTYKVKTLAVNYDDRDYEQGNRTFRDRLFTIPEAGMMSIPYGVFIPIKNKYWDLTECAEALDKYNKENNIKVQYYNPKQNDETDDEEDEE